MVRRRLVVEESKGSVAQEQVVWIGGRIIRYEIPTMTILLQLWAQGMQFINIPLHRALADAQTLSKLFCAVGPEFQ
ncbi:hypothetical protein K649_05790 [Meiothermus ruber DSM 1279]|uniref:Uncharacterized protein n=1 Tax=Meiothermus ruber (strain ATCC 35948 / DSM 1279 / VKM B-1258 / 21) TaxID=504728 RepID=M9X8N0_MEIRD|nr:hypothetical protein K649_05790 [Meiothermus ruber DSM 1279]